MAHTGSYAQSLRNEFPYTKPSVMKTGPIFGFGYRPSWLFGNIAQAKIIKKYKLNSMLAQQSAREIERTKRSFQDVVDSATISAFEAELKIPWGADGDHLKTENHVLEAVQAGCTHFTYDVSEELLKGPENVVEKISKLYSTTLKARQNNDFTAEISLDETPYTTKIDDILYIVEKLEKKNIKINEIAPRFPGFFEKAIDYYYKIENNKKIKDTEEFEKYLYKIKEIANNLNLKISIHSGSDKFIIYPSIAKILKNNIHLKTAGTFYLEELKIIARHNPELFKEIFNFSLKQFQKDRATYELNTDIQNIPDITKLDGNKIASLLESGTGNNDLRQVLHVTYGSVLTLVDASGRYVFSERCREILAQNEEEIYREFERHIKRHISSFVNIT